MNLNILPFEALKTALGSATPGIWVRHGQCRRHDPSGAGLLKFVGKVIAPRRKLCVKPDGTTGTYDQWPRFGTIVRISPSKVETLTNIDQLALDDSFAIFATGGHNCTSQKLDITPVVTETAFRPDSRFIHTIGKTHPLGQYDLVNCFFVISDYNLPLDPSAIKAGDWVEVLAGFYCYNGHVSEESDGSLRVYEAPGSMGAKTAITDPTAAFFKVKNSGLTTH